MILIDGGSGDEIRFTIYDLTQESVIPVDLAKLVMDTARGNAEYIGSLAPDHRGRGVGTEATRLVLDYAFHVANMACARLSVIEANTGELVTLTVEEIDSDAVGGTRETETTSRPPTPCSVGLGHALKAYQENLSHSFILDGTGLEIEADSRAEVVRVAALPGHTEADLTGENTIKAYVRHGIDLSTMIALCFDAACR